MALTRSLIRNAATPPRDARIMLAGLVVANADGSPRAGVLGGANPSIVSALPSMNVAVAAAEFVTTKGAADGVAIFGNDGAVNVPIDAAPTANSRIDVIYVKHNDDTTGDADANPIFGAAKGTAAASPVKPAIPTGALELATLRIYSGTTATNGGSNTLINTYAMTAARGADVPFRTKASLDAWTSAAVGQRAFGMDAPGTLYAWDGSAWVTAASAGGELAYAETVGETSGIPGGGSIVALTGGGALSLSVTVAKSTRVVISARALAPATSSSLQVGTILSGATVHNPAIDGVDVGVGTGATVVSRLVITLQAGTTVITLGRRASVSGGVIRNPSILVTTL